MKAIPEATGFSGFLKFEKTTIFNVPYKQKNEQPETNKKDIEHF